MSKRLINSQVRVLIVDNEERTVELYKEFLNLWGYSFVVAEGAGEALLDDAKRKAKEYRCHIALVDMRLKDDFDEEDISGLNLIKEIKPTEAIIISGYKTLELVLKIVKDRVASDFFDKGANPEILKEKIDEVITEKWRFHKEILIEPAHILQDIEETKNISSIPQQFHDQIYDILIRLFPKAKKLRLEKMNSFPEALNYSTVPRPGSVILRVYEDELQPVILKIARSQKIHKEIENFNKYISGRLKGNYKPTLEGYATLWDIGGIKLSHVDSVEGTFANFIFKQPVDKIENSLRHFFLEAWSPHYKNVLYTSNTSLFSLYRGVWGEKWLEKANVCSMPTPLGMMGEKIWQEVRTNNNPLDFLKKMIENEGTENDPSLVKETQEAITHGDLHADNLLIDGGQHGWVIDFERTGWGHVLQDFVELDADIIVRSTCAREEFPDFYHFSLAITTENPIEEISSINSSLGDDDETRKTLSIISTIRNLALQSANTNDFRQYLLGLYFNIIFRATLDKNEEKRKHNKCELRTWMLASILSRRIIHWDDED